MSEIEHNLEHSAVNRLIVAQQESTGFVQSVDVILNDIAARKCGLPRETTGICISTSGYNGYLVQNEMDNYVRADYIPSEHAQEVGNRINLKVKQKPKPQPLEIKHTQATVSDSATLIIEAKKEKAAREFDDRLIMNKQIGPVFSIPESREEFIASSLLSDAGPGDYGKTLRRIYEKFISDHNKAPSTLVNLGCSDKDNFNQVRHLILSHDAQIRTGFCLITEFTNDTADILIINEDNKPLAKISAPIISYNESVHFSDNEQFDRDFDVELHSIDIYSEDSTYVELVLTKPSADTLEGDTVGPFEDYKLCNPHDSKLPQLLDAIASIQFAFDAHNLPPLEYADYSAGTILTVDEMNCLDIQKAITKEASLIKEIRQSMIDMTPNNLPEKEASNTSVELSM